MSREKRSLLALVTPWRLLLVAVFGVTAVIVYFRFVHGLGSVTNLSDETPWGIWVGFDILAGVGLAAGGFVMAAAVYVFQLKRFKPLVRMAILTAMLGYILFVVGLILEIGRPWNMWRCLTNHNFHSPLFEIAWCVMLYTTVLILEFSQVVFEKLGWKRMQRLFHAVSVPLVIIGVLLSTLHQSTLGTLFTIVPHKLHPLWYSPILPVHFFTSCIAAGLAMVCFESFLSWRFLKHPPRMDLLPSLARVMVVVLVIYFVLRIEDLVTRDLQIAYAFQLSFPAALFWLENLLFVVLPIAIVVTQGKRMTPLALFVASFSAVLGFIMHRFNVAVAGMQFIEPTGYFPDWKEFVVSVALVMAGFVAAGLAVRWFPVHSHDQPQEDPNMYRVQWKDVSAPASGGEGEAR